MVFNATFNNISAISWQFVHKGDIITVKCLFLITGKHQKIWKKDKLNSEMAWKIWKISKSNSEKIWNIQKKIVKREGKYGRKQ